MTAVAVLERVSIVTPLAVRLRDEATRAFVADGLSVVVWPRSNPEMRTTALRNATNVFVLRNLPGMRDVEQGSGDSAFWAAQSAQRQFALEVRDTTGRFLPFTMNIGLPQRRVLGIALTSPPSSPLAIQIGEEGGSLPLFSSPSRTVPDAMGVLRAELVDAATNTPAAWALVEVKAGEQRAVIGMADRDGRVMLPLFYPKPVITLGSPGSVNTPLAQQTWTVDVTVRYRRRDPIPEVPDLIDVLTQAAATAWKEVSPMTAWTNATLQFGRELRLSTLGAEGAKTSTLLITAAGSPP